MNPKTIPYPAFLFGAALTVAVAGVGSAWTESDRSLDVRVLTDSALISSDDPNVRGSLTVRWKGQDVSNLRLLELTVENTGSEPIRPSDFATPLILTISEEDPGEILDVRSVDAHPPTVATNVQTTPKRVDIQPLLLNPGDGFSLSLVTTSVAPLALRTQARIAGVHDVTLADGRRLDAKGEKINQDSGSVLDFIAIVGLFFDVVVCGFLISRAMFSNEDDWSFKGRNIGILAWPAILGLGVPAYALTLWMRGVNVDQMAVLVLTVAVSVGALSGMLLIVLASLETRITVSISSKTPTR